MLKSSPRQRWIKLMILRTGDSNVTFASLGYLKAVKTVTLYPFLKSWPPELPHVSFKGGAVKLYHCHHVLTRCPLPVQWPCAIIVNVHIFKNKVQIMRAAKKAHDLSYRGALIMLFKDFSAAAVKKQQEFYPVYSCLRRGESSLPCCTQPSSRLNTTGRRDSFNTLNMLDFPENNL